MFKQAEEKNVVMADANQKSGKAKKNPSRKVSNNGGVSPGASQMVSRKVNFGINIEVYSGYCVAASNGVNFGG